MPNELVFFVVYGPMRDEPEVQRLSLDATAQEHFSQRLLSAASSLISEDLTVVELHPLHKPDETEVHEILEFPLPLVMEGAFENPSTTTQFPANQLSTARLRAIVGVEQDNRGAVARVHFQRKTQAEIVRPSGGLLQSANTFKKLTKPVLKIDDKVHAVWENETLRFRSARSVASFLDIEDHAREATDEDVTEVLNMAKISVTDADGFISRLKPWHRKRLAMLRNSGLLAEIDPKEAADLASDFVEIEIQGDGENAAICLPDDPGTLRKTLKFLCEEYYYGVLTQKRYEANSTRPI